MFISVNLFGWDNVIKFGMFININYTLIKTKHKWTLVTTTDIFWYWLISLLFYSVVWDDQWMKAAVHFLCTNNTLRDSRVLTAVKRSVLVFWVVTTCSFLDGYQHFRAIYHLHLQGRSRWTSQIRRPPSNILRPYKCICSWASILGNQPIVGKARWLLGTITKTCSVDPSLASYLSEELKYESMWTIHGLFSTSHVKH
jgi:hypothetical protein